MAPTPPYDAAQEKLITALVDWLTETALEMRRVREEKQQSERAVLSRWNRFWSWWGVHGAHFSGFSTIIIALIGGLWTVNVYLNQEQIRLEQQDEQRRQQEKDLVSRFAMDLTDASKRNMAANLLAFQAGEAALPLLVNQLRDAVTRGDAAEFRTALASALATVGPAGLDEAVRLNRDASANYFSGPRSGENVTSRLMVETTQQVIRHFLLQQPEVARSDEAKLDGIRLLKPGLLLEDLSGIKLRGALLYGANLCGTKLIGADLSRTRLYGGYFANVDLSEALLDGVEFSEDWEAEDRHPPYMSGATLKQARGAEIDFGRANLEHSNLQSAVLTGARLGDAKLKESNLTNADLTGADLTNADLTNADLSRARLVRVQFYGSNLYKANFAEANLEGAILFWPGEPAKSFQPDRERSLHQGAFVFGADFTGATGLSEDSLRYLCRFGAQGVPGGCEGMPKEQVAPPPDLETRWSGSSSSSCA